MDTETHFPGLTPVFDLDAVGETRGTFGLQLVFYDLGYRAQSGGGGCEVFLETRGNPKTKFGYQKPGILR